MRKKLSANLAVFKWDVRDSVMVYFNDLPDKEDLYYYLTIILNECNSIEEVKEVIPKSIPIKAYPVMYVPQENKTRLITEEQYNYALQFIKEKALERILLDDEAS